MFDLNLAVGSINVKEDESISSEEEETSSTNGDGASSFTFNFFDKGTSCDLVEKDISTDLAWVESGRLVTRELFPVSHGIGVERTTTAVVEQRLKAKKSRRGPRSRSSQYRGVTFYRRTGRWESHIWDSGKQVYLGGFDTALSAARAYDRAAIKFRGVEADINFNVNDYEEDMKKLKNLSKQEFVHTLRRQNPGFSRGSSKYRGIALHKCIGRWEAQKEKLFSLKDGEIFRDAVANFGSSKCNGTNLMISEPCQKENVSRRHDLELNLCMSTSSQKDSHHSGSFRSHSNYVVQDARNLKMYKENLVSTRSVYNPWLTGVPVALGQFMNPRPNNEERAGHEQRIKYFTDLEALGNRALHMNDQVGSCQVSTLSMMTMTAASSGFSSPTTAALYPMTLNLCFSSQPNALINDSKINPYLPRP